MSQAEAGVALRALVGMEICDLDDPTGSWSPVVDVDEDRDALHLVTAAGWRFGGMVAYLTVRPFGIDDGSWQVELPGLHAIVRPQRERRR